MRSFLFVSLFLLAAPSFAAEKVVANACPNLDGHFTCTYDGQFGHKVFELDGQTKRDARGDTMYVVNQKEVYTDGERHHTDTLPILDQWADDVNYVGTCTSENTIHITGDARVKKYNTRADLDGDLISENQSAQLRATFRVSMGFFGTDIEVPCIRK